MALLTQGDRRPRTFIQYNAKTGELLTSEKDPSTGQRNVQAHRAVTGELVSVKIKADPGNPEAGVDPHHKVDVVLRDGDHDFQITANASVPAAVEMMARLNAADIGHPMLIGTYTIDKGTPYLNGDGVQAEDKHGLTLRQGPNFGQKVDPFYGEGKSRPETIFEKNDDGSFVMKGGKKKVDKEACEAARLECVSELVIAVSERLAGNGHGQSQAEGVDPAQAEGSAQRERQRG